MTKESIIVGAMFNKYILRTLSALALISPISIVGIDKTRDILVDRKRTNIPTHMIVIAIILGQISAAVCKTAISRLNLHQNHTAIAYTISSIISRMIPFVILSRINFNRKNSAIFDIAGIKKLLMSFISKDRILMLYVFGISSMIGYFGIKVIKNIKEQIDDLDANIDTCIRNFNNRHYLINDSDLE